MKIDFTTEQLNVLDKAIQQLPYYVAAPLILHINKEIEKQRTDKDTQLDVAAIQKRFDAAVDARDIPSGATPRQDPYRGD